MVVTLFRGDIEIHYIFGHCHIIFIKLSDHIDETVGNRNAGSNYQYVLSQLERSSNRDS